MQSQLANDFVEEALDALAYSPLFFDFSLEELRAAARRARRRARSLPRVRKGRDAGLASRTQRTACSAR
jgi:hypothetical protein